MTLRKGSDVGKLQVSRWVKWIVHEHMLAENLAINPLPALLAGNKVGIVVLILLRGIKPLQKPPSMW